MDEEKISKQEEKKNMIEEAKSVAARIEAANANLEKLLQRQEEMQIENTLAGSSQVSPKEEKVESAAEYAKRVLQNGFEN